MKKNPENINDVKDMLERKIKMNEELTELYRAWGIQSTTEEYESSLPELRNVLKQIDDPESRIDYDYFIRRRTRSIQIAAELFKAIGYVSDEIRSQINHATQMDVAAQVIALHKKGKIGEHESINVVEAVIQASQA